MNVYLVTNMQNGKQYVGITRRTVEERWSEHLQEARGSRSQRALSRAIRKYGVESFSVLGIANAEDWQSLCDAEVRVIDTLGTKVPAGYNMTDGGDGAIGLCQESFDQMREKCRLLRHTPETKQRISETGKGRKHSPEAKAKISSARKGKPLSEEHRQKLAVAKIGKKRPDRSPEHCRKISEGLKAAHKRRKESGK